MGYTLIYYHRLHFPAISGQTLQVLRDYYALSLYLGAVHMFYRANMSFTDAQTSSFLKEYYGLISKPSFNLHFVKDGWFSKLHARRKMFDLAKNAELPVIIVTRTLDHAVTAVKLRDNLMDRHVKVILELHETAMPHMVYQEENRKFKAAMSRLMERRVFKKVDGIVCTAPPQLNVLDEKFPGHSAAVVLPNGFNMDFFKILPERNKAGDDKIFRLRYAGQIPGWKGFQAVIEALQYLPDNVVIDIAGGNPGTETATREMLSGYCNKYGVQHKVNYIGPLLPTHVPSFLMEADCLVLPLGSNVQSSLFTSPMKLFEYAASGVPMIVTRQPTTTSLIEDGVHALMVGPDSAQELAEAVKRLMNDKNLRGKLAGNARIFAGQYSSDRRAVHYMDFIDKLMGPK